MEEAESLFELAASVRAFGVDDINIFLKMIVSSLLKMSFRAANNEGLCLDTLDCQ